MTFSDGKVKQARRPRGRGKLHGGVSTVQWASEVVLMTLMDGN